MNWSVAILLGTLHSVAGLALPHRPQPRPQLGSRLSRHGAPTQPPFALGNRATPLGAASARRFAPLLQAQPREEGEQWERELTRVEEVWEVRGNFTSTLFQGLAEYKLNEEAKVAIV